MNPKTDIGTLFRETTERFREAGMENPALEAAVIICSAAGEPAHMVHTKPQKILSQNERTECESRVMRRLAKEPCAYATGVKEFFSRNFAVGPQTLIPRPETETAVEAALEKIPLGKKIQAIDVGTGCGCIAVTLKKERPEISVAASDISPGALQKAAENSRAHGAEISLAHSDIISCFADACADIVVANLPYVSEKEFENLPEEIRLFEPKGALVSGETGLEQIEKLLSDAPRIMRSGGWCVVEIGDGQERGCRRIFLRSGFSGVSARLDISGKTRAVFGFWKK